MSYDYIIKQYSKSIFGLSIEQCKQPEEIINNLSANNSIITSSCTKPFVKIKKGDRVFFTYYGIPAVNELWPFLNALARISNNVINLDEEEKKLAGQIAGNLKLFVTPDCTKCPIAAELLYQVSILNDKINLEIIDIDEYNEFIDKYRVLSTPKIIFNEKEFPGGFPPHILLKMLAKSASS
ncbi:glutaredoxin [Acidianus sulfidivorans JP7]|uniref:Glutaredoxin n=1 Tax=Acidianus sulfidivorans JP7 TaxID=619593 RepID=A0A2U9IQN1_9CREN|nr:thioredoxin family protein [Acidianus sulfidivorans]AWR98330.1 glutaredoxin [Acidianus sulfidivorans JP7]